MHRERLSESFLDMTRPLLTFVLWPPTPAVPGSSVRRCPGNQSAARPLVMEPGTARRVLVPGCQQICDGRFVSGRLGLCQWRPDSSLQPGARSWDRMTRSHSLRWAPGVFAGSPVRLCTATLPPSCLPDRLRQVQSSHWPRARAGLASVDLAESSCVDWLMRRGPGQVGRIGAPSPGKMGSEDRSPCLAF